MTPCESLSVAKLVFLGYTHQGKQGPCGIWVDNMIQRPIKMLPGNPFIVLTIVLESFESPAKCPKLLLFKVRNFTDTLIGYSYHKLLMQSQNFLHGKIPN